MDITDTAGNALSARLSSAMKAGRGAEVRNAALELIAKYGEDARIKRNAARLLLWAGDFAGALVNLPDDDHQSRARAHAYLGEFDYAVAELDLAYNCGRDPRGAEGAAYELSRVLNSAGRSPPAWMAQPPLPPTPRNKEPRWAQLIRSGEFDEAMVALRDVRLIDPAATLPRIGLDPVPLWLGQDVGHLVLVGHLGNGDILQFGRYIQFARHRCERLSLVVDPLLRNIAERCLPADDVVTLGQEKPLLQLADAFMAICLDLAYVVEARWAVPMTITPIERTVPNLGKGLQIGLRWGTSPLGDDARRRSIRFSELEALRSLLPDAHFHSLQTGAAARAAAPWVASHQLRTYDDTVSLIAALDAVVTVDTSVAHLAGNVGKPVHLILTDFEDWRWGRGETTPWYPTMTIYRGDVANSVWRISERLRER